MRPTTVLRNEHRIIDIVLACLSRIADNLQREGFVDTDSAKAALDFLTLFADQAHHRKEELLLFDKLECRGFPVKGGPTGVMRSEHEVGRALLRRMRLAIEAMERETPGAAKAFLFASREYIRVLRNHIMKEDHCLFTLAEQALTEEDFGEMEVAFDVFDHEFEANGARERCMRIVQKLAERYGVAGNRGLCQVPLEGAGARRL